MSKETRLLHGKSKEDLLRFGRQYDFPGHAKYPADHPIWKSTVGLNNISPLDAWYDDNYLSKAIDNLIYIYWWCVDHDKYHDFIKRIDKAFDTIDTEPLNLLRTIQARFTVAKIAPKVTALKDTTMLNILKESGINLNDYPGVYIPMAGFGGIVKAIKRYNANIDIETYDINTEFCYYYGWTQRDVLAQKIKTDKIVIACPPFGATYENWGQKSEFEPDSMYSFKEWCDKIIEHVEAPNYIFIGPSETNSEKVGNQNGLFAKKVGIRWYPEYSRKDK